MIMQSCDEHDKSGQCMATPLRESYQAIITNIIIACPVPFATNEIYYMDSRGSLFRPGSCLAINYGV